MIKDLPANGFSWVAVNGQKAWAEVVIMAISAALIHAALRLGARAAGGEWVSIMGETDANFSFPA